MSIKKYDLTLRNFNDIIIKLILKKCAFNNIEEYEFETLNPNFDLFINILTNHVNYSQNNYNLTNIKDKYFFFYVPLSYLTDETKEYFFKKYFIKNGYSNFDEYFLNFSYYLPCINISIQKKNIYESNTHAQYNYSENINNELNKNTLNYNNSENINNDINKNTLNYNNSLFYFENNEIKKMPSQSINYKNLYCVIKKKKLFVRAYNQELDYSTRPNDYLNNTWNIFDRIIKYNKNLKAWIFPYIYIKQLIGLGVIFHFRD